MSTDSDDQFDSDEEEDFESDEEELDSDEEEALMVVVAAAAAAVVIGATFVVTHLVLRNRVMCALFLTRWSLDQD